MPYHESSLRQQLLSASYLNTEHVKEEKVLTLLKHPGHSPPSVSTCMPKLKWSPLENMGDCLHTKNQATHLIKMMQSFWVDSTKVKSATSNGFEVPSGWWWSKA